MDILFVAAELAPFIKGSSVADAVFALSKTLKSLGHRVTIVLPRFPVFEAGGLLAARRLTPLALPQVAATQPGDSPREVIAFDGRLASGVEIVLLDAKLSSGASLYGEGACEGPASLTAQGAAVLCRAAIELMRQRVAVDQAFDLVHAHDWAGAMVPYLMRLVPELSATQSVLTIHDVRRQGFFERVSAGGAQDAFAALAAFGLTEEHFTPSKLEFYGGLNLLKGGVLAADLLTTVSPSYAREITRPEGGARLDGVLRARKDAVLGIVNGVDYAVWNPATDPAPPARFDGDDPSNKARCKTSLLAELGLELDPARPLVVSLGPHSPDFGGDVLVDALGRVLKQDLYFVSAGAVDVGVREGLEAAARRAPGRAAVLAQVPDNMVHKLLAAADFVLTPSRYEPCGTLHLRAQRYGAVPIATNHGGFLDTLVDLDAALETGTGFLLEGDTADAIVGGVGRALTAFRHPRFAAVRRRVMRLDVSWDRPGRRYAQAYKQLVQKDLPAVGVAPTA
jgi:starch synthase